MLSIDEVKKIALLSRIELRDGEALKFQKDLSAILDYVEELKKVDTDGLEIVASVTGLENVSRNDEAITADNHQDILDEAPETKDGYYKVKAIL